MSKFVTVKRVIKSKYLSFTMFILEDFTMFILEDFVNVTRVEKICISKMYYY